MFVPVLLAIAGAALNGDTLITWGREVREWSLPALRSRVLPFPAADRGEGGCIADAGTKRWALVTQEGKRLVRRRAPEFVAEVLDEEVEMHDCVAAMGGVLMIHKFAQLRLYTGPRQYKEVYSIYTHSNEGGLLVGPEGIYAGNYWFRPPEWREFAINTWHEQPESATMRLAALGVDVVMAQGHVGEDARVARFTAPADRTQLWNELRLSDGLHLRRPHALATDGVDKLVVAEDAGAGSRVFLLSDGGRMEQAGTTEGVHTAFFVNGRVLLVGGRGPIWLEDKRRRPASSPHVQGKKGR